VINREPESVRLYADADGNPVEMPNVAAAGPLALEPATELLAEFENPMPHGLLGDHDPAFNQHFSNKTQAQRESEIKPNGVGGDLWKRCRL
jgi:hypothetical protein